MLLYIRRKVKSNRKSDMAKNARKRGKSMRNGNAPSPYTKYQKTPYKYTFKSKKVVDITPQLLGKRDKKQYLEAAE